MRIAVHDYCGHPFQVQLSRELARRGHEVLHLYSPSVQSAHGALEKMPSDPVGFDLAPVMLDRPFEKYQPARRALQELEYGRRLVRRVRPFGPEVVLSANTPLLSQRELVRAMARDGARFVFWQQDVLGVGIRNALRSRFGVVGDGIGRAFEGVEAKMLRTSDAVVTISEDFVPLLRRAGVVGSAAYVVENWAPLGELPQRPRDNAWAVRLGLVDRPVFLYAGTLGMKHNPALLLDLADAVQGLGAIVAVVSEGLGADWLREEGKGVANLVQLPYQPYESLPDVLATGDVLLCLLETDAGMFSVPSKVLSYLCAGRPVLAAVPPSNLAARVVAHAGAGITVDPTDKDGFIAGALDLLADPSPGRAARKYAERTFDIAAIGERFESILSPAAQPAGSNAISVLP
jgi:colanic acid biosynthesis glycosyl transferase WcaI